MSAFYYGEKECNTLSLMYYEGTEEQWIAIVIGDNNDCLTGATIHYNYVED